MKLASATGESDAGARAVHGEDEPRSDENGEENNYDGQECSRARHAEQFYIRLRDLQDLQDFVRVPDAEADAKNCRDGLQPLVEVSQFS